MANPEEQRQSGVITRKGLLLKESRESKGITIETVHELTKIPLDVLHAIEEGYTVRMVSAYYFKGFIKMYAKFLGLDPQLVLDEPVPSKHSAEPVVVPVVVDKRSIKFNDFLARQNKRQLLVRIVVGVVLVIAGISIIIFFKNMKSAPPVLFVKREQPRKKMVANPVIDKKVPEKPKAKAKAEEKPVSRPVVSQAPVSTPAQGEDETTPTKSAKRTEGKKVSLTIKARVTGWLQVKVDGNIVFQSTMREGTAESWQAEKSIELSGKNINNLEFEVNGKVLGQLGKAERGARRVIITGDGLSVRK